MTTAIRCPRWPCRGTIIAVREEDGLHGVCSQCSRPYQPEVLEPLPLITGTQEPGVPRKRSPGSDANFYVPCEKCGQRVHHKALRTHLTTQHGGEPRPATYSHKKGGTGYQRGQEPILTPREFAV